MRPEPWNEDHRAIRLFQRRDTGEMCWLRTPDKQSVKWEIVNPKRRGRNRRKAHSKACGSPLKALAEWAKHAEALVEAGWVELPPPRILALGEQRLAIEVPTDLKRHWAIWTIGEEDEAEWEEQKYPGMLEAVLACRDDLKQRYADGWRDVIADWPGSYPQLGRLFKEHTETVRINRKAINRHAYGRAKKGATGSFGPTWWSTKAGKVQMIGYEVEDKRHGFCAHYDADVLTAQTALLDDDPCGFQVLYSGEHGGLSELHWCVDGELHAALTVGEVPFLIEQVLRKSDTPDAGPLAAVRGHCNRLVIYLERGKRQKKEFYRPDGTLRTRETYTKSVASTVEHFHPDGKTVASAGALAEGKKRDGKWSFYDTTGTLTEERTYQQGSLTQTSQPQATQSSA